MEEALVNLLLFQLREKFFKVLDGQPPGGAAAGDARQIRGVQASSAMRAFMRGDM
jgi:hypothetical protein